MDLECCVWHNWKHPLHTSVILMEVWLYIHIIFNNVFECTFFYRIKFQTFAISASRNKTKGPILLRVPKLVMLSCLVFPLLFMLAFSHLWLWMSTTTHKKLGDEKVYSNKSSAQRELRAGTEAEAMEECCFLACSQAYTWLLFWYSSGLYICIRMVPPTVGWAIIHQWAIKKISTDVSTGNMVEAVLQLKFLLFKYMKLAPNTII